MKASQWNPKLRLIYTVPAVIILHLALRHYLASHDVVSSIFAMGPHIPLSDLLLVCVFVLVRLTVVLVLPPVLAWHATRWALLRLGSRQRPIREHEGKSTVNSR